MIDLFHSKYLFPQIRPAGIDISHSSQMQVLLENTTFLLHRIITIMKIIRIAGIIGGRVLYEEIWYTLQIFTVKEQLKFNKTTVLLPFNESVRKVH